MKFRGKVFIVVGARGNGKSHFVKRTTQHVHESRFRVYDVQGEYYDYDDDELLPDMDEFLQEVLFMRESVIVFEEATVFFSNKGCDKKIKKLLVGARHNKNTVFLLFHSIRSIPLELYELTDYVVIFNTLDIEEIVEKKHSLLYQRWKKVRGTPRKFEIVKINPSNL